MTEGNFNVSPVLDEGIYQTCQNPVTGEIFLEKIGTKFEFGFKLYGIDNVLVDHVLNTYNKQENKHNLGVLLNGAKGTGKTVTAKYLANKLGLPVIVCDKPYNGLANFLASINHDCVFFFDEFEKNFRLKCDDGEDCAGEDLLSIMDGVYSGNNCHVFLLTTNELKVNDNLISRPSRIRYLKSFGDVIDRKILEEYVDDNLTRKEYREEIMDFVDTLTMVTIDIVKSIVDEINLHNCHIDEFKSFFNVKESTFTYYIRSWYVDIYDGVASDGIDKEAFLKGCHRGYSYSSSKSKALSDGESQIDEDWRPAYDTIYTNKSAKLFKKGERLMKGSRWIIDDIDLDKDYMLLSDAERRNRYRHIYIENIDTKPSIYDEARRYTDPYWYDD